MIRVDGQIDMTKLVVAFSNFANTSTKLLALYTNTPLVPLSGTGWRLDGFESG